MRAVKDGKNQVCKGIALVAKLFDSKFSYQFTEEKRITLQFVEILEEMFPGKHGDSESELSWRFDS